MASPIGTGPSLLPQTVWHWAVDGAEPRIGPESELIQQLATGRLPPYALVWREGWGEWLPAMQVAELAEAFPDLAPGALGRLDRRTARPSLLPGIPPVPVSEYPRLRHLAKAAPLGWPDGFEGPEQEVITSEVPAVVLEEAARIMTEPTPPRDLGLVEAIERASRLPPERPCLLPPEHSALFAVERASLPAQVTEPTPASRPALPLATELGLHALLAEATPPRSGSQWLRAHGLWLALAVLVLGLGAAFGLRWLGAPALASFGLSRATERRALRPAADRAAPVEARPTPLGCRSLQPPALLDDWAVVDVRPVLHPLASDRQVAIGYAQSNRSATGGVIDVGSLRFERQFWQQQDRPVYSVTPLELDGALRYHVERQGASVAFARALAAEPPARIGRGADALVLAKLEQRAERPLWPLPPGASVSVAEVAEHPRGFTLALRAATELGHVHVGLIDPAGEALAPLTSVGEAGWDLGRPSLASGPEQTVLAVARRGEGERADELMLARARNGQLPTALRRFELPAPAAPEVVAPLVAALPDGGFALMWSQGLGDERQVRLQRLSPELRPLGAPLDVSAAAPRASTAALHWIGDRLLAVYFASRDGGHSLWAGTVACGP